MLERFRSLAYAITGGAAALPGLWERIGDDFSGCLILVEPNVASLQGRVTYVPSLMRHYGWKVGDIKWRNMNPGSGASYHIEDLFKELDPDTNHVRKSTYHQAKLYFLAVDEFTVIASGHRGRNTRWRRTAVRSNSADQHGV